MCSPLKPKVDLLRDGRQLNFIPAFELLRKGKVVQGQLQITGARTIAQAVEAVALKEDQLLIGRVGDRLEVEAVQLPVHHATAQVLLLIQLINLMRKRKSVKIEKGKNVY